MSKKTNLIVGAAATVAATSLLVGCNLYGKEKYKVHLKQMVEILSTQLKLNGV